MKCSQLQRSFNNSVGEVLSILMAGKFEAGYEVGTGRIQMIKYVKFYQ